MATEVKRIQIMQGNKADLNTSTLLSGEEVLALDTGEVGIKTAGGGMVWFLLASVLPSANKFLQMASGGTVNGVTVADYVTEQGTSGEWAYEKWNSGKIKAWVHHNFGTVSLTHDADAALYYAMLTLTPPAVMSALSHCEATLQSNGYCYGSLSSYSKANGIVYRMIDPTSYSPSVSLDCYIIGT